MSCSVVKPNNLILSYLGGEEHFSRFWPQSIKPDLKPYKVRPKVYTGKKKSPWPSEASLPARTGADIKTARRFPARGSTKVYVSQVLREVTAYFLRRFVILVGGSVIPVGWRMLLGVLLRTCGFAGGKESMLYGHNTQIRPNITEYHQ